ncbi:MAG: hypothetical protein ACPHJ3_21100, partial [Rubripirellula sp.]
YNAFTFRDSPDVTHEIFAAKFALAVLVAWYLGTDVPIPVICPAFDNLWTSDCGEGEFARVALGMGS